MADRATYRGTSLWVNGKQLNRVTSFGSSTNLPREDIFEMGNKGVVSVADDIPSVEATIESNEIGSIRTLLLLSGKMGSIDAQGEPTNETGLDFANEFDNARCDLWAYVKPDTSTTWAQLIPNAYVTSANYSFGADGNFTERYSLSSDSKFWGLNGTGISSYDMTAQTFTLVDPSLIVKITSLYEVKGGFWVPVPVSEISIDTPNKQLKLSNAVWSAGKTFRVVALVKSVTAGTFTQKGTTGALRRGYAKISLLKSVTWDKDSSGLRKVTGYTPVELSGIQSATLDVSLEREQLVELGNKYVYSRPLQYPIGVNISLEMTQRDFKLYQELTGATDVLSPDSMQNDRGLLVELYSDLEKTTLTKAFYVPYMTPSDDGFNMGLQGSGTANMSFRSHDLIVTNSSTLVEA